ncbi:MAG: GreA/GreB family elongation factor [Oscillospiraceae bacterium]|nr:GreA/GreB family elongation factor [Oscillospiraceae bacterium]
MYDELTSVDLQKMQDEIDYRQLTLRPKLIAEVQDARSFGDLSENFEYKAAKREKNRNDSRIRYLQRMIQTAKVISVDAPADGVGLFDRVELYLPEDEETMTVQLVTMMRTDATAGRISKASPMGAALMGRKVGDTVHICVREDYGYDAVIRSIEKGHDDASMDIMQY